MIIGIIALALLLFILLLRPKRGTRGSTPAQRRDDSSGIIFDETPAASWHGSALPDDRFEPGGGDSGGGGASGSWDDPGDSGSDSGGDNS
ncbi:MAG: hypothetical protein DCF31_14295 [Alphaproteobacteria bacterium]|nr:MAG: hypothetical protein DCF31_14295 [Alphaproteobacteria bacterium]